MNCEGTGRFWVRERVRFCDGTRVDGREQGGTSHLTMLHALLVHIDM
jgi:hypothetical protein